MLKKLTFMLFVMGLLFTTSGCIANRATANLASGMELGKLKIFYVVPQQDDRETCDLIKNNLFKRGYIIASGSQNQPSYQADVIVTYASRWTWDFTMYMLELTITFRDPTNNFPLAVGNSLHGSLTRKSPEEMVDEVLTSIFSAESVHTDYAL